MSGDCPNGDDEPAPLVHQDGAKGSVTDHRTRTMRSMTSLTRKGQITIPKEVRDRLGLQPFDRLEVSLRDGEATLRKAYLSVDELAGRVPPLDRNLPIEKPPEIAWDEWVEQATFSLSSRKASSSEAVRVLASQRLYDLARPEIATIKRSLLSNRGIRLDHKESIMQALAVYGSIKLDVADCIYAEHTRRERLDGIMSYDQDFDRIPGIQRLEP